MKEQTFSDLICNIISTIKEDEWNETVEIQPNFADIDALVKEALPA